jgi:protease I
MRVAFLATDMVEQVELTEPWAAVESRAGRRSGSAWRKGASRASTTSIGLTASRSTAPSVTRASTTTTRSWSRAVWRTPTRCAPIREAVQFVRGFFEQGKPVAVICHGSWMLVEADVVRNRELTSWPSLATDIRNAGGIWHDAEVVVDNGLVTSRKPDDLPAFCEKLVEEFSEGRHAGQKASVGAAR